MVEVLPLAMLTFIVGALIVAHAWAVVSAHNEAAAAARAGARAFVESGPADALTSAIEAAQESIDPERRRSAQWDVDLAGRPGRCRPVTVRVTTKVPLLRLPWVGVSGDVTVTAAHSEIVDPFRDGLTGIADCHG
jgi:hypothetical protein